VFFKIALDIEYQLPELAEMGVCQITVNEETVQRGQPDFQYTNQQQAKKYLAN
jgi:hypothetical protein